MLTAVREVAKARMLEGTSRIPREMLRAWTKTWRGEERPGSELE
jgi:hypothetical protein